MRPSTVLRENNNWKGTSSYATHKNTYSLSVGFFVEFVEQEEEHDSVHADPPNKCTWIVAVDEEKLESMEHDQDELNLFVKKNGEQKIGF